MNVLHFSHTGVRLAAVLLWMLAMAGCVDLGRPPVADRSPERTDRPTRPEEVPVEREVKPPPAAVPPVRDATETTARRPSPAPTQRTPELKRSQPGSRRTHVVGQGDTLYAIAWRYQLDVDGLARANGLRAPYTIFPGQRLRLESRPGAAPAPAVVPQMPAVQTRDITWTWPVGLSPVKKFSKKNKGIDYSIEPGREIAVGSAGTGVVVYAGNGIGGFERLIIVRHGPHLLSAYSFNGAIAVREQQQVKAGQKIADIKNVGRTSQKLHFELRRDGIPINPGTVITG